MSRMTNYLENKLIDHIFRNQAFSAPATLYISLHTADPGETGANELPVSGNYSRAAIASSLANWTATQGGNAGASSGTGGATSNSAAANFPVPSANWGLVTHFAIWDSAAGGNPLFYAPLTTSKTINANDSVSFAADTLNVTFA